MDFIKKPMDIEKKSFEEWYANQSKYHNDDKEVIDDV